MHSYMIEWILLMTIIALFILFWQYIRVNNTLEERALGLFHQWQSCNLKEEAGRQATEDAARPSGSVEPSVAEASSFSQQEEYFGRAVR